jgi:hypothetical protein
MMMKNSWWIKTDYWVQTVLICCILASAATIIGLYLALLLLMFFGAWQIISGFVGAVKGDRLQQIYFFVVILYFVFGGIGSNARSPVPMIVILLIALVIGIWKYTVTRADYICLEIIDTPNTDTNDLLDA